MKRQVFAALAIMTIAFSAVTASAQDSVFPSTNDQNSSNGWAHVDVVDTGIGKVTLQFDNPRDYFASCFEFRSDGNPSQALKDDNPNALISDLYPYVCVGGAGESSPHEITLHAYEYVEVRLSFGAEGDERFDWTPFYVDGCKDGEWEDHGFRNQGQCNQFVNTDRDSRD